MRVTSTLLIAFSVLALGLGAVAFLAFLRPVRSVSGSGTLGKKAFVPSHTISRYQASSAATRQSWTQEKFTIPDSYVFDIQIDGVAEPIRFSLEKSAGERFQVGQRVRVKYQERGIPLFWKRIMVLEMAAAD